MSALSFALLSQDFIPSIPSFIGKVDLWGVSLKEQPRRLTERIPDYDISDIAACFKDLTKKKFPLDEARDIDELVRKSRSELTQTKKRLRRLG